MMENFKNYAFPVEITSKLEYVLSYKGEILLLSTDIDRIKSDANIDSHLYGRDINDYIVTTYIAPPNQDDENESDLEDEDEEEDDEYNDDDYRYHLTLESSFVSKYKLINFEELHNIVY